MHLERAGALVANDFVAAGHVSGHFDFNLVRFEGCFHGLNLGDFVAVEPQHASRAIHDTLCFHSNHD